MGGVVGGGAHADTVADLSALSVAEGALIGDAISDLRGRADTSLSIPDESTSASALRNAGIALQIISIDTLALVSIRVSISISETR